MLSVVETRKNGNHQSKIVMPRTKGITTEIVTITPSIAAEMLSRNIEGKNRKFRSTVAARYARDMKSGKWQMTGEAIKFDTSRRLLDGQHRLSACVQSEMSFQSVVIYNLPSEAQDAMDGGKPRSAADVLSLHGYHNTFIIGGTCRLLLAERDGVISHASSYSTSQILGVLDKHPGLLRCTLAPNVVPRGILATQISYINYVATQFLKVPATAESFVHVLKTGVPSYDGDPIHAYRERIIRQAKDKATSIKRPAAWNALKHSWNMFAKKLPVSSLKFARLNVDIEGLDLKKL